MPAALALLAGAGQPAQAASGEVTDDLRAQLKQFWTVNRVPGPTQDALLDKLEAGQTWDVMSGESAPVSTRTVRTAGENRTIETYPDGSIAVTSIQMPTSTTKPGVVGPLAVGNCRTSVSGSGYTNRYDCQANSTTGVVEMGFYISYSITGGYDSIIDVNSPYVRADGGTASDTSLAIRKAAENSTGSAYASIKTIYQARNGGGSKTLELRALVGQNTAWTRWEAGL
ncbi:hypothetical protein Q760_15935 [Cellulomonas cellasea DSM 20118]|uniref:Uncharacterized protein n=2 Tax=Cellulomonas cellasea TaxID=43670 RepID=A0A0A0B798_9CELL|nr:hypothetical protein Q760_15935 [Cellulomonas cellasea DSM 20118]GEA86628.1 hypothetical protein CCE01nite_05770 [Cellulomonas cellasea]